MMISRLLSGALFIFLLMAECSAQSPIASNYYITLYKYFSYIPALPIPVPQGEHAGDVYSIPGVIYARKATCFPELKADTKQTLLLKTITVTRSSIDASIDVDGPALVEIAARTGIKLKDIVNISYGQSGKATWEQLLPVDLEKLMVGHAVNSCRKYLDAKLRSNPGSTPALGVPWIIQSVWHATVNVSSMTISAVNANTAATFEREFGGKKKGSVEFKREANGLVVADSGATEFPIAWRPAFISVTHYDEIRKLMDESWFKYVWVKLGIEKSDQEILAILRDDFKLDRKTIPTPKELGVKMSQGPAMRFDEKNKEHIEYLKAVTVLSGLSQAIDHDSDIRLR
jgi:hypothetical protein